MSMPCLLRAARPCAVSREQPLRASNVQVVLEGLLVAPGLGAPPQELQQYLQLLAEAYRRTHALAAKLQPVAGPDCNTAVRRAALVGSEHLGTEVHPFGVHHVPLIMRRTAGREVDDTPGRQPNGPLNQLACRLQEDCTQL